MKTNNAINNSRSSRFLVSSLACAELKVNFVEGFAVLWLAPFHVSRSRFLVSSFCACGVSRFQWLKPFLVSGFNGYAVSGFLWLRRLRRTGKAHFLLPLLFLSFLNG